MNKRSLLLPVISEKAMRLVEESNTYVFEVPPSATKVEVAAAVAAEFKVGVTNVNTVNRRGKAKRQRVQRGRRSIPGRRSGRKLAYVTLKSGDKIKLFEGAENA